MCLIHISQVILYFVPYILFIMSIVFVPYIYYNTSIKRNESEENNMERIEELEKELTKVCGNYENDCSKCPKQKECDEYCKLAQIYEIVNR